MDMETKKIPVRPKAQEDFGTDEFSGEPYIEDEGDSDATRMKK